jgi:predicted DNA-binding ArsR family transcriptional regulator
VCKYELHTKKPARKAPAEQPKVNVEGKVKLADLEDLIVTTLMADKNFQPTVEDIAKLGDPVVMAGNLRSTRPSAGRTAAGSASRSSPES